MRNTLLICFAILTGASAVAQGMTAIKLKTIVAQVADTLQNTGNAFQFLYEKKLLICVFDEKANRMRLISPIIERDALDEEQLLNALVANFHSALDVRYALSDEIIWSVYTHPLESLSPDQLKDAISQVYRAAVTFGTTYSSSDLVFPGNSRKKEKPFPEKDLQKS